MINSKPLPANKPDTDANIPQHPFHIEFKPGSPVRSPGILIRINNMIERIKSSDGYTEAIGRDLCIIDGQKLPSQPATKLSLTIARIEGRKKVKLIFSKLNHDGISLETRRNNGRWEFLCIVMTKPWYDERPLLNAATPEIREYRATWWDNDKANGDFSTIQKITLAP